MFGETAHLEPSTDPRLRVDLDMATAPMPVRIILAGELDGDEVPRLRRAVAGVPVAGDVRDLRVDASGLTFLDSAGIRALLVFRERAIAAGARMVVDRASANVHRVLEIAGLWDIIGLSDPVDSD